MATFPSSETIKPTYGQVKTSKPNRRRIVFGDGYEARVIFGLNQNMKVFQLTFEVSETDADTIETFLDARADDSTSFDFTPPGESSSAKFVCDSWSKSIPYLNRATINATFRQVPEP
jgi:phage-related protein